MTIKLDTTTAMQFQSDSNCRAMVFCAAESFDSTWKPADIAFPSNSELRCNQEEVKVNLKGLKNKPGSTRPADITPFLRKKTEFLNNVELIYALTTKESPQKYVLSVNLVQRKTIEMLVQALKSGKFLGKDRVVRESRCLPFFEIALSNLYQCKIERKTTT
ncbi:E3 SUMO-protein ligase pli1 [Lithohypha guttulata]|uniref:E3 SUMO-protein ligase pli1 n=1 Tax=Lithohypha guttulata TaxID=1690604 RepID=UPI00315D1C44